MPDPSLLTDLKLIEDKKSFIVDILVRELLNADEHKSLLICWLLTELIEKNNLTMNYGMLLKALIIMTILK